tara:strand:- start:9519 stop:11756 length:2238 start_codon:yes stop_codon:yes gene_type:complete
VSNLLEGLNSQQKAAVESIDGPVMVLAGAGSGKTKTLVTRIAYLMDDMQVSPFRILALTFSNKAAREMRERISQMTGLDIGALQVTTFHAFCARVLRQEADFIGLSRSFTIYDGTESKALMKQVLGRRGIGPKELNPKDVLYYIEQLHHNGYWPGRKDHDLDIDESDPFYLYFLEYTEELHRANATDFGGLITGVLELFSKYPDVLKRYQDRFRYLLVDEYQDTNRCQFDLVTLLASQHSNLCVVGDEDQSIYSWRGADIRNILDFEESFPKAKILRLEQNYRSSKNIIEAASHVIARNTQRKGKTMWTDNADGESIRVIENESDKKEAEWIAKEIVRLARSEGIPYTDMAIFYRANSQSRIIEDALRQINIRYRVIGGIKFYERKEVKDLMAYLKLVVNPKDSLSLSRIINVPVRGIGATSLRRLEDEAVRSGKSLWEALETLVIDFSAFSHIRITAKVKSSLTTFVSFVQELISLNEQKAKPSDLFERALHESGYWDSLKAAKDHESLARMENIQELGNAIAQFEGDHPQAGLGEFLESVTLDTTTDESDSLGDVSLMTVHGAKGLEFGHVFVTGCEENVFPSWRSLEDGSGADEEERRLFYVAMTRAMKRLYLTFARGRMLFGQLKFNGPSRFLLEIPKDYLQWISPKGIPKTNGYFNSNANDDSDDFDGFTDFDDEPVIQVAAPKPSSKFPKGSRISHGLYGEGQVLDSEGAGVDEIVVIKFIDGTRKKFKVKFAPLSLVN